jgi:hypothetical protein
MDEIVVYCADVGSIAQRRFAWARGTPNGHVEEDFGGGDEIADLVEEIVRDLDAGHLVALGFECPLFVPVPEDAQDLGRARPIDRDRSWSAGPGIAVLGVGLVQVPWVLRAIRARRGHTPTYLRWEPATFERPGLFLWEAFVTGEAKGVDHRHDARIAVQTFLSALPDPGDRAATTPYLSLVGAALLWSGLSADVALLTEPCLDLRAKAPAATG